MLRFKDWLMLFVAISSIVVGVMLPEIGAPFQPYPMHSMMVLLFFSFLSIQSGALAGPANTSPFAVARFVIVKLILLPLAAYLAFLWLFPKYAPAALLLGGSSSGVAAPFFAVLANANISMVIGMVIISSVLVPFTVPAMVKIVLGRSMEISFFSMFRLLCLVVFVPWILASLLRRIAPSFAERLRGLQYAVGLACFMVTNLGVFSKYSAFLRADPSTVAGALGAAALLAATGFAAGIAISPGQTLSDRLAAIIGFAFINNILVLVFSSEFFGPLEPTVAAMYTIPFFMLIFPLRIYQHLACRRSAAAAHSPARYGAEDAACK